MSLEEYQAQLADVEALISEAPGDESFLKLRDDLLELIALTKQEEENQQAPQGQTMSAASLKNDYKFETSTDSLLSNTAAVPLDINNQQDEKTSSVDTPVPAVAKIDKKIKQKIKKPFEIPEHLVPLESDTEVQRNKKKRAIKALKSKHKAALKEYETTVKQSAWLDFSQKKRKKGKGPGESIFKTADDGGKVGVVTASTNTAAVTSTSANPKRQRHTF
jgi:survival-of-motor-neuron-related-splicing factor 30